MARRGAQIDAIVSLARRQNGCATRSQLLGLGLPATTISRWVRASRLFAIHAGVYAIGRPLTTPVEFAAAAVLACGPLAVLSHGSALALWTLSRWPREIHVTTPLRCRRPGIVVHRARSLAPQDVRTQLGIRATSPARTLLDCAPSVTDAALGRLLADGRRSGYLHAGQLDDALIRFVNHPGRRRVLALRDDTQAPTRSRFEDLFVPFCARYGLPRPQVNVRVGGREVDAYFPAERLIVELDGWDFHRDRVQFEADRDHDADALSLGVVTYRLTWSRLIGAPTREAERLHRALAARRRLTA